VPFNLLCHLSFHALLQNQHLPVMKNIQHIFISSNREQFQWKVLRLPKLQWVPDFLEHQLNQDLPENMKRVGKSTSWLIWQQIISSIFKLPDSIESSTPYLTMEPLYPGLPLAPTWPGEPATPLGPISPRLPSTPWMPASPRAPGPPCFPLAPTRPRFPRLAVWPTRPYQKIIAVVNIFHFKENDRDRKRIYMFTEITLSVEDLKKTVHIWWERLRRYYWCSI
jgi:hypothetical protein